MVFFIICYFLGQYYFEGRYDLVKFVKLVGESGLYLHLRIGPYVCAEWNFGSHLSFSFFFKLKAFFFFYLSCLFGIMLVLFLQYSF